MIHDKLSFVERRAKFVWKVSVSLSPSTLKTRCEKTPNVEANLRVVPQHKVDAQYVRYINELYLDTASTKWLKEQRLY
jgi:hypothetical protein